MHAYNTARVQLPRNKALHSARQHDVHIEPRIFSQVLTGLSANVQDGARLNIAANGFLGGRFE